MVFNRSAVVDPKSMAYHWKGVNENGVTTHNHTQVVLSSRSGSIRFHYACIGILDLDLYLEDLGEADFIALLVHLHLP